MFFYDSTIYVEKESFEDLLSDFIPLLTDRKKQPPLTKLIDTAFADKRAGRSNDTDYQFYTECFNCANEETTKETKGRKRTPKKDSFDFSKPFNKQTFDECYRGDATPTPMFLKSISVALRLTPKEADELLCGYGYLPFYSKNIFDLSIYSVLMLNEMPVITRNSGFDPFAEIENRYNKAIKIIEEKTQKSDLKDLGEITTDKIHTSHFLKDFARSAYWADENTFLEFVKENAEYFSIRHGTVLGEHEKYTTAVNGLYEVSSNDSDGGNNPKSEHNYRRFSFKSLIQEFVDHSGTHFNRDVIDFVQDGSTDDFRIKQFEQSHSVKLSNEEKKKFRSYFVPSRELMILLWLYCYTFTYNRDVDKLLPCSTKTKTKLAEYLKKTSPDNHAELVKNLVCESEAYKNNFNLRAFLFPDYVSEVYEWDGNEAKTRINHKLSRFGWGELSDKNRFDRIINMLLSFSITRSGEIIRTASEAYGTGKNIQKRLTPKFEFSSISVPHPLQFIFVMLNSAVKEKYQRDSHRARKMEKVYNFFDSLSSDDKQKVKSKDSHIYYMLRNKKYTKIIDGKLYMDTDNEELYYLIEKGDPVLLGHTIPYSDIDPHCTDKKKTVTLKKLIKEEIMFFPLASSLYEKV